MNRKKRAINSLFAILSLLLASEATLAADERFARAETLYSQKNYLAAEKLLKEILASKSKDPFSLYLLGNIYLIQKRLTEASQAYRTCVQAGADTRPGQYAAMALEQIEAASKVNKTTEQEPAAPTANTNSPRATKQEEEKQSILKALKEAIDRNQKDYKIQADKLTLEEEQQIELAPSNQAEWKNAEYRLVRENAVAQIKQEFEAKRRALKEIYDRKESAINQDFKRRLAPFSSN